ncbi:MAG: response regulator transcription factor [Myxococcota bacterium]
MTDLGAIRVFLVDDHTIVREGLRALLDDCGDVRVVGEAEDGREAVTKVLEDPPDVVVMDLAMPRLNGVDATAQIRKEAPNVQVIVLTMHAGPEYVRPAIRAGAKGYLIKGSGLSDLVSAIRAVARGQAFVSPEAAAVLVEDASGVVPTGELTSREREVLQLVAEGHSSPEIAKMLHLSVKTVEGHRQRIMAKVGASNAVGLVRHALRLGLIS